MKFFWYLIVGVALLTPALSKPAQAANFSRCKDSSTTAALRGTLCATFHVPLRASGPKIGAAGKVVNLFVRKFPATGHAKGTLWLVSGGPGESGTTFYPFLKTLRAAFPGFDLLIPDPRGTGFSTRLCPKEESVGSPDGLALVGAEWATCWATINATPDYARAFSLTNAAYDLADLIAQYPSRVPTYVYGVSYGTQVVSRMLVLSHKHLDGAILDSLADRPTQSRRRERITAGESLVSQNHVGDREISSIAAIDPACQHHQRFGERCAAAHDEGASRERTAGLVVQVEHTGIASQSQPATLPARQVFQRRANIVAAHACSDRILYSVDYPFGSLKGGRAFLGALPVDSETLAKIAHGNADRLLKLTV